MKSTSNFSIRARALAGCLAGMLAIAACGSSESTDGERDRNVDVGVTVGGFGDPTTGIATTRLGDFSFRRAAGAQSRRQIDGSWLVMIDSWSMSSIGFERVFNIARMTPNGSFDDAFGTNGVVTIRTPAATNGLARLTRYGQLLVLGYDTVKIGDNSTESVPSWVRRYDAATGQLDPGFSDGTLVLDDALRNSTIYSMDGGKGDTLVVVSTSKSNSDTAEYVLTQFVGGARNKLFGGIMSDGSSGSIVIPLVAFPSNDKTTWIHDAFVNLERDGSITTVFAQAITNCPFANRTGECQTVATRRGLGIQQFGLDGSPMLKMAEEGGGEILWLDDAENPSGVPTQNFRIDDVAEGDEQAANEHFVTVSLSAGLPNVYKTNSSYTRLDVGSLLAPVGLNIEAVPNAEFGKDLRPIFTYVPMEKPVIVGSLVDPSPGGSFFWTANYPVEQATYGPRFGDYPFSVLRVADLQALDSGTFVNIETIGARTESRGGVAILWSGRGYAKFDKAGQPNALFAGADTMTSSPLEGVNPFSGELVLSTRLLAGEGDYFYTAAVGGFLGGVSTLHLQRYNVNGGTGARTDGEPITIKTGDVNPIAFGQKWLATDGNDAIYFRAFHRNQFGVGKVLISTGGLDKSYGNGGFAPLGSNEPPEPGTNQLPAPWFVAGLQANTNGSVDAIALEWMPSANASRAAVKVTTRRIPANGATDLSSPATTFITDPEQVGCGCAGYVAPEVAFSVVVDSEQRIIIGTVGTDIVEGQSVPAGFVKLLRFGTDGNADTTFGSNGVALITGLTGLLELPPTIVARANGEILVGYSTTRATIGKGGAYVVEGQYLQLARVGVTGTPVDFTPPPPSPAADTIADLINSAPMPNAPGGGVASLPAADQPAVAVTEQTAAAALPADIVRVSPDNTVRITLATSVADRAIDVRWSVPAALVGSSAKYTVTATPGGQTCVTATTSCVFKKLDPWTAYTFKVKTVSASSGTPADSLASNPVKPVRIVKRGSRTEPTKLITPASTGKQTWKATGGCTVTKDGKSFLATKDGALCALSLTTAKAGKVPKTTRTITVVVRAVAK